MRVSRATRVRGAWGVAADTSRRTVGGDRVSDIKLNTMLDAEQREQYQNTKEIQALLREAKTIAIVGLSTEKTKASNMVASYLIDKGYDVIPVHPTATEILGRKVYASVADIPFAVDIVDVFRPAEEADAITAAGDAG